MINTQRPILTPEQEAAIFHAVGRRIAAIVTDSSSPPIAKQIPDVADIPVLGAFVSLKKVGELRSCMGALADAMPLGDAVDQAAARTAKDDPRFPPIAASELSELEMDVWILWGLEPVSGPAHRRFEQIEIGRHGIQIILGPNSGLLLPGVAVEHGMNAGEFLEALCRKAGLTRGAWADDRATVFRFEGRAISGPFASVRLESREMAVKIGVSERFQWQGTPGHGPGMSDLEQFQLICRQYLFALFERGRPSDFHPGLFDGKVSGVSVMAETPDRPPLTCSVFSIRPEIQFQPSLFGMVRLVAEQMEQMGLTDLELRNTKLDIAVFWGPQLLGTARSCDFSDIDTAQRSLSLSSQLGWALRYHPTATAETILEEMITYLNLEDRDPTQVFSMQTLSTAPSLLISNMSQRQAGDVERATAAAGAFYPADPGSMNAELDRFFDRATAGIHGKAGEKSSLPESFSGAMIPHAGWIYSGRLAAATLARIAVPETVLIFAPKHRPGGLEFAVAPYERWRIPGGVVAGNTALASRMAASVDLLHFDALPHEQEHAIEVQLPLLARLRPTVRVIGITLAGAAWPVIERAAMQLAGFLARLPEWPLLLISSDMNHYGTEEETDLVDHMVLDAMRRRDPETMLATVRENGISMCGATGAALVMETLRLTDRLNEAILVGHTTSAAQTGDRSRVVGYAGMLFR